MQELKEAKVYLGRTERAQDGIDVDEMDCYFYFFYFPV